MSVITLIVEPPADHRALLRATLAGGVSLPALRSALQAGAPVFAEELYGRREFHDVADDLERMIGVLQSAGARFQVYEEGHPIALETLQNILAASRARFEPPIS